MKKLTIVLFMGITHLGFAQIGVNTPNPKLFHMDGKKE